MAKTTDREIVRAAVVLLTNGLLPSQVPARLMVLFDIRQDRAARLAQQALQKRREQVRK